MPYARKRRTTNKKATKSRSGVSKRRTYKRKYSNFRPQRLLRIGFPKTTMIKLRYVDGIALNPGIGTLAQHFFRANGAYDPDTTGGGHQPMNWDMWTALYNHYTVVGAKITCRFHDNATAYGNGMLAGIILSDDTTVTTDASTVMEQGLARYRMANASPSANAGRGLVLSKGFSCKKFFNITNPTDNTNRLGAGVTALPTEQAYFCVFLGAPPNSVIDFASHQVTVQLDYIVIFSEPKEQPQS